MQPSSPREAYRETCGERLPNTAIAGLNITSIPDLSVERFNYYYQQASKVNSKVNWIATLQAGPPFTPILLSDAPLTSIPTPSVQTITHQKKKRNQKTREHYKKKKAQAQATQVTVQVQEVDQVKEMEHSAPSSEMEPGKHVVLQRTMVSWVHRCWHAAIQSDWMSGMTLVECGPNRMSRLGIG